jgi:hypothetical protein
MILPTFVVALLVAVVGLPALVMLGRAGVGNLHETRMRSIAQTASDIERARANLTTQRQAVLDQITRTVATVTELTTRSADAYARPSVQVAPGQ